MRTVADQFAETLAAAGRSSLHGGAMDARGSGELFGSGDAFVDYFQFKKDDRCTLSDGMSTGKSTIPAERFVRGEAKFRLASFMCDFSVIDAALQGQNLRERPNMGRMAAVGD